MKLIDRWVDSLNVFRNIFYSNDDLNSKNKEIVNNRLSDLMSEACCSLSETINKCVSKGVVDIFEEDINNLLFLYKFDDRIMNKEYVKSCLYKAKCLRGAMTNIYFDKVSNDGTLCTMISILTSDVKKYNYILVNKNTVDRFINSSVEDRHSMIDKTLFGVSMDHMNINMNPNVSAYQYILSLISAYGYVFMMTNHCKWMFINKYTNYLIYNLPPSIVKSKFVNKIIDTVKKLKFGGSLLQYKYLHDITYRFMKINDLVTIEKMDEEIIKQRPL